MVGGDSPPPLCFFLRSSKYVDLIAKSFSDFSYRHIKDALPLLQKRLKDSTLITVKVTNELSVPIAALCKYITYSVKTLVLKNLSVVGKGKF